MIRTILTGILVLGLTATGWAAGEKVGASKELALHRLSQAESAARDIQDPAQKTAALAQLANLYAEAGDLDGARDIASRLGQTDRHRTIMQMATTFANHGDFAAAVAIARTTKDDQARFNQLGAVGRIWAKSDIAAARKLAAELPQPQRGRVLRAITIELATRGDIDSAKTTLALIPEGEKQDAPLYILLAEGVDGDLNAVAAKAGVAPEALPLNDFVKAALKAGNVGRAVRIQLAMTSPAQKSAAYIDLAEWYARRNNSVDAQRTLAAALAETDKIAAGNADTAAFNKAYRYLQIAQLQIGANDSAGAVKSIHLAQQNTEKLDPTLFESLGGKTALVALLVQAGALQEARAMATQTDGSIISAARPILASGYAAQGQTDEAEKLTSSQSPQGDFDMYVSMARSLLQIKPVPPQE